MIEEIIMMSSLLIGSPIDKNNYGFPEAVLPRYERIEHPRKNTKIPYTGYKPSRNAVPRRRIDNVYKQ